MSGRKTKQNKHLSRRKKGMLAMVVQFREEHPLQVFSLFSFLSAPPDFEGTNKGAGDVTFAKFPGLLTAVTKLCVRACVHVSILPEV